MTSPQLLCIQENLVSLSKKNRMVGSFLYDRFGESVARVEGLLVEPETYRLRFLVIRMGGFLGTGGKRVIIPEEVCEVKDLGKITTAWTRESLSDAPCPADVHHVTENERSLIRSYFDL